jgi:hypothetical protein
MLDSITMYTFKFNFPYNELMKNQFTICEQVINSTALIVTNQDD